MLSYAIKRISRSWKLFAALALGMTLAATFFGGLNVAADTVGKQALDAQLVIPQSMSISILDILASITLWVHTKPLLITT